MTDKRGLMIGTRIFELAPEYGYEHQSDLARAMGVSNAQLTRVRQGIRRITPSFMAAALRAFPGKKLSDLFEFEEREEQGVA